MGDLLGSPCVAPLFLIIFKATFYFCQSGENGVANKEEETNISTSLFDYF